MKKKILIFCILILCLSYFLYGAAVPGTIVEIDGQIQIQRKGTTEWIDAKIGMKVFEGDKIKSLLATSAIIKLPDESEVTIAENSVITFSTLSPKKKISLKLNFGGLRTNVLKAGRIGQMKFSISTPTAVAGVRGTDFEVAEGFNGSDFMVVDGIVEVQAKGKKVILKKQEKVRVDKQGKIGNKEKAKPGETLIKVSKKIKEKFLKRKKKIKEKEVKKEEKPDTTVVTDTRVVVKEDTTPVISEEDTTVVAVSPPKAPVINEPVDGKTLSEKEVNVAGSGEDNSYVTLKVKNSEVSKVLVKNGEFSFSKVVLTEGENKISVFASIKAEGQELKSDESMVTVKVITSVPVPIITSPGPGSNIDRGAAPVINLTSSDFLEWTNRNPLEISGMISYNNQLLFPDITGSWKTAGGAGIEGEINITFNIGTESFDYTTRSDASGIFTLSGVSVNLSDDNFATKINNEAVPAPGGSLQYSWILEPGDNKLNISAEESKVGIKLLVKGTTGELESAAAAYTYTSAGKTASLTKTQKLDSYEPEAEVDELVQDGIITLRVRDPEPTSGVYKVEAEGVSFKRVEGGEKDSYQVWEGRLSVVKRVIPPPPPDRKEFVRQFNIKVKVIDRAENETRRSFTILVRQ